MVAAIGGGLARLLKQPVILGYLVAGLGLAWWWFPNSARLTVELMGQLGVTLLLFLVGLELPLIQLKKMGRVALIAGVGQIIITLGLGFLLARFLGFPPVTSWFLGLGLTFGSTIIVVKLLSEKGDLQSLYGRIAMGYLLVQDFVAIGFLVMTGSLTGGEINWIQAGMAIIKSISLVGLAVWVSEHAVKKAVDWVAGSTELLFIGAIGWCLGVAAVVGSPAVGLSYEIGGFLAGLTLASAIEQTQIISRVRPLRDFFMMWFFIAMGANIHLSQIAGMGLSIAAFTVYVLVISPIILMLILGILGYRKRTFFMVGLTVAQVSEFSLILTARAVSSGLVESQALAVLSAVALLTMLISSYFIMHSDRLYHYLKFPIRIFERKRNIQEEEALPLTGHVVLFGHNRVGSLVRPHLEKLGKQVVVVDFNPEIVEELTQEKVNAVFGDMGDLEIYENLKLGFADLIISTVPDIKDELILMGEIARLKNGKPGVVLTAEDNIDAGKLYAAGADYVLVPRSIGGEFLNTIFEHKGWSKQVLRNYGQRHLSRLVKT